ncbi:MAG: NAD(P)H-dependent oxidoreductase [Bacteroidota bacterium]|nr:NAD(P)H-dependent oxidoreductase [Bacteroidota bacterium]
MPHIAIISGSVRTGRQSHKVALYLQNFITENKLASAEILDLKEYNFPVLEERLSRTANPDAQMKSFSEKVAKADAVIMVFPEYNAGYPASVKNAIDLLYEEWYHKPVGLASVSSGNFAGLTALNLLQTIFLRIKAIPIASTFPVPNVESTFDEQGNPSDKASTDKRAAGFMKELLWYTEAVRRMKE